MNSNKTPLIINPEAGRGTARRIWPRIYDLLEQHQIPYESYFTKYHGHASLLASTLVKNDLKNELEKIIVVGGDGSINEVISGIYNYCAKKLDRLKLGVIPAGTGNDFARSLGIPLDSQKAIKIIKKDNTRLIDLGMVNSRPFVNICGVGFDAAVAEELNKNRGILPGKIAYLYTLLKCLIKFKNISLNITLDNKERIESKALLAAVGNTGFYGGGMKIIPSAKPDDDYFHICLVKDVGILEILQTLPGLYSGKHINHPKVDEYMAKSVYIDSNTPGLTVHVDGEPLSQLPANFYISSHKLNVILPYKA